MKGIVLDVETISCADLKKCGAHNYASHASTHISILCWEDLDTGYVGVIMNPKLATRSNSEQDIEEFYNLYTLLVENKIKIVSHNAPFEKVILNHCLNKLLEDVGVKETVDFELKNRDFIDTLTLSNVYRGPASLADSSKYFKCGKEKDLFGNKLVKAACKGRDTKPRSNKTTTCKIPSAWVQIGDYYYKAGFELYERLLQYCKSDVEVTTLLYRELTSQKRTNDLGEFLQEVQTGYKMAMEMNDRGVNIDTGWLNSLLEARENVFDALESHTHLCWGLNPAQRTVILNKIRETGYEIDGMGKDDILKSLRYNDESHNETKNQLREYLRLNKTSLLKLDAINNQKGKDNKIYDMFKYCGAYATGRFSSFGVQLQNLARPADKQDMDSATELIKNSNLNHKPDEVAGAIRGCFIPSKGKKFFIADLSQIELRRVLDKTGYPEKVKYLADGGDEYCEFASAIHNKKVTQKDPERKDGKAFILGLGYGMGENKFMDEYEKIKKESISRAKAKHFKSIFIGRYPKIPVMWAKYQKMIDEAFQSKKDLRVKLATGRYLNYGRLRSRFFTDKKTGRKNSSISYFDGKKWSGVYGSKVFQHVVQAECRDILLIKLNALHEAGADLVMTVHDEVIVEVDQNKSLEDLKKLWYHAGEDKIEKHFPTMIIDSDCVLIERYWSH